MKFKTLGGLCLLLSAIVSLQVCAEQVVPDVKVLNSTQWVVEPGKSGEGLPVILEFSKRCFFVGSGTLDPQGFRANLRVERKICAGDSGEAIESTVKGFVVASDHRAGLPIECLDVFANGAGSRLCLNGRLESGTLGSLVLTQP